MILVKSEALNKEITVEREIGRFGDPQKGPTIVVFAAIHGNEPSGVFALHEVFSKLKRLTVLFHGNIVALCGNHQALKNGKRYIRHDLNRIWEKENLDRIKNNGNGGVSVADEMSEQDYIYHRIEDIFKNHKPPFYFIDLHTTSSDSVPFITLNDTLRNREFAMHFPLPIILGIEEFLSGTLMSYINAVGPIAIGFEAGRHDDPASIENHISCLWLTLEAAGCLQKRDIPEYDHHYSNLSRQSLDGRKVFEIRFRYLRTETEEFEMLPGFKNFQRIKKTKLLARNFKGDILASESGRIFLPLYQNLGDDGFFIIREIKKFWLKVSARLRRYDAEWLLKVLPGIEHHHCDKHCFKASKKIARWLVVDLFHLLGYRRLYSSATHHYFRRRRFDTKEPEISYQDLTQINI
ncbi:MAG: succinylglutamate desuccinylase/aspartoacylase family protein [Calditrichaeota bacterium]|nr:succinylglutamate desuccinylase/aspartoacylase family protein [Calditrichota bacterium]